MCNHILANMLYLILVSQIKTPNLRKLLQLPKHQILYYTNLKFLNVKKINDGLPKGRKAGSKEKWGNLGKKLRDYQS